MALHEEDGLPAEGRGAFSEAEGVEILRETKGDEGVFLKEGDPHRVEGTPEACSPEGCSPVLGMQDGGSGGQDNMCESQGALEQRLQVPVRHSEKCTDFEGTRNDHPLPVKEEPDEFMSISCGAGERFSPPTCDPCRGAPITGPKYFIPDIVYAPSDVDPADVLHIPEDSPPSQQNLEVDRLQRVFAEVRIASWNVAGTSAKRVKTLISADLQADVIAIQEYPKMDAGWRHLKGERFNGLVFQNYFMCRAIGVLYDAKKFHLRGRRSSQRGIWVQLQHIETSQSIWIGSIHVPNNEGREECRRLVDQFMKELPKNATGAAMGDFNTHFRWVVADGACVPSIISGKWSDLRQCMAEYGFQQVPPSPEQADAPTFHSRKGNVSSTQIDGRFVKGLQGRLEICEDSRVEVGTDHDRIVLSGVLAGPGQRVKRVKAGGPLRVVRPPPPCHRCVSQSVGGACGEVL